MTQQQIARGTKRRSRCDLCIKPQAGRAGDFNRSIRPFKSKARLVPLRQLVTQPIAVLIRWSAKQNLYLRLDFEMLGCLVTSRRPPTVLPLVVFLWEAGVEISTGKRVNTTKKVSMCRFKHCSLYPSLKLLEILNTHFGSSGSIQIVKRF